jgi:hypothetical protein
MQDIALESKINSSQAQGTKDNPGVVENIAHTAKAETQAAKDKVDILAKDLDKFQHHY